MRISAFNADLTTFGGGTFAFLELTRRLLEKGHRVKVFTLRSGARAAGLLREATIHELPFRPLPRAVEQTFQMPAFIRHIKGMRKEFEAADVTYLHGYPYSPLVMGVIRNPTVYFCDEPPRYFYEKDIFTGTRQKLGNLLDRTIARPLKAADRRFVRRARLVLANSRYSAGYLRRVYGNDINLKVHHYGVDAAHFTPGNGRRPYLLSLGHLLPGKGHDMVIRAVASLRNPPPLHIVGDGPCGRSLRNLASRISVDVRFSPRAPYAELPDAYRGAVVACFGYRREPFGLTLLEAMACATPVVALNEGGPRDSVVHGETGLFCPPKDEAMAKAIASLLGDPERCRAMGAAGRKRVEERFTWKLSSERFEALLGEVAERGKT